MKETVAMLNQQYVMPEGLAPYAGVTAKSPWLASESEKRQRRQGAVPARGAHLQFKLLLLLCKPGQVPRRPRSHVL